MKKFISLFCVIALLSAFAPAVMADLIAEETGNIDSSVIFGATPTAAPENTVPEDSAVENNSSHSGLGTAGNTGNAGTQTGADSAPESMTGSVDAENPFHDVSAGDWFYDDVMYVYQNHIMSGVESNLFSPKTGVTRGMMITILYRTANEPETASAAFSDVDASMWYAKAVSWGAANQIVSGTGNNQFSPNADITREQLAVMLYNYRKISGNADKKADITSYSDHDVVSAWANAAMSWAVGNGIISGKSETELAPKDGATRAEAAAIIRRFAALMQ